VVEHFVPQGVHLKWVFANQNGAKKRFNNMGDCLISSKLNMRASISVSPYSWLRRDLCADRSPMRYSVSGI
jgi:hypothetical protein